MTKWNIVILLYVAVGITVGFVILIAIGLRNFRLWSVFTSFRKQSVEEIERKTFGYDNSISASIITDDSGKVVSVNPSAERLLGWSEKEFVGDDLHRIIPEEWWGPHKAGVERSKGKEMEMKVYEIRAIKKDKIEIPIELILIKENYRGQYYYVSRIRDITKEVTERKKYLLEIEVLKIKIDILNKGEELGSTGSWLWDLESGELMVSEGYRLINGLEAKEKFKAHELRNRVWEDDDKLVADALEKMRRGEQYDISYRIARASDFKIIFVRSIVKPIKNENGIVAFAHGSTRLLQTLNIRDVDKIK